MDPTPTEAERREAEEYARTAKTENEYGPHTRHDVVLAYAAALAKCRVQSVCEVCGGTGAYLTESARSEIAMGHGYSPTPEDYIECDCVVGKVVAERERLAKIVWDYFNNKWPDGSMHDAQEELSNAIRGGGQ